MTTPNLWPERFKEEYTPTRDPNTPLVVQDVTRMAGMPFNLLIHVNAPVTDEELAKIALLLTSAWNGHMSGDV
jgi:hypothetical protein